MTPLGRFTSRVLRENAQNPGTEIPPMQQHVNSAHDRLCFWKISGARRLNLAFRRYRRRDCATRWRSELDE